MALRIPFVIIAVVVCCATACGRGQGKPAHQTVPAGAGSCLADRVQLGDYDSMAARSMCASESTTACEQLCEGGDASACVELATGMQQQDLQDPRALPLFEKACLLGNHNACTNFAATTTAGANPTDADLVCATRLFSATCSFGEHFGCGMHAMAMHLGLGVTQDTAAARDVAERACDELGMFPCAVLGRIHEDLGELGAARTAHQRGCDTGYPDSCREAERLGQTTDI